MNWNRSLTHALLFLLFMQGTGAFQEESPGAELLSEAPISPLKRLLRTPQTVEPARDAEASDARVEYQVIGTDSDGLQKLIGQASLLAAGVPGWAMGVVLNGKTALESTFGVASLRSSSRVVPETLFNMGQATCRLTWLLAASMDNAGLVYATEAVAENPSDFRMTDVRSFRAVTFRHLLEMTAGIPSYSDAIVDPSWAVSEDVFGVISQAPVVSAPGRVYQKSYLSVSAGGYMLGRRSNPEMDYFNAYTKAMKTHVFEPLGMDSATFSAYDAGDGLAEGHREKDSGGFETTRRWESEAYVFAPALSAKCSLRDALKWLKLELNGGHMENGSVFCSPSLLSLSADPSGGLGLFQQRKSGALTMVCLSSSFDCHSALMVWVPEYRSGVVVLVNADGIQVQRMMDGVVLAFAEYLNRQRAEEAHAAPPLPEVADRDFSRWPSKGGVPHITR